MQREDMQGMLQLQMCLQPGVGSAVWPACNTVCNTCLHALGCLLARPISDNHLGRAESNAYTAPAGHTTLS